jgi:hypothetical protein
MSRTCTVTAVMAIVALIGQSASASLVVNGDFEMPAISQNFVPVSAGEATITGWTVDQEQVDLVNIIGGEFYANTGNQAIDLAGTPGRGSISQALPTVAGQTYLVSFFASSNGQARIDGLTLFWEGAEVETITTPAYETWTQFTYELQASSTSTTLRFRGNVDGFLGSLLDTVSVTEIPAPSAAAMATVLMLGAARRRRAS